MRSKYVYTRVMLKLSGEALNGKEPHGYCADAVKDVVDSIISVKQKELELGIVVGAGNIWRGINGESSGMNRVTADHMGMLATVMNGLCLRDALDSAGQKAVVMTSLALTGVAEPYDRIKANQYFKDGYTVIFAGGTGNPFFTTDSAATLRALETECQAVLKATKVDGIYTADPFKDPTAERYETITYTECLAKQLKVMDSTAFSMASDNNMPIIVFDFSDQSNLEKVLRGDTSICTVVTN